MNLKEALEIRRSMRQFSDKLVPEELINEIIRLAVCAPSACNAQNWHFILIDNRKLIKSICDHGGSVTLTTAPVIILVLYNNQTANVEYADHVQSASAAIQNMLLAACDQGLAGCWICHLPGKRVLRRLLDIPTYYDPIAAVALGYPETPPVAVPRKYKLSEIISYNKFERCNTVKEKGAFIFKRLLLALYRRLPVGVKKVFLNKFLDKNFVKKFDN